MRHRRENTLQRKLPLTPALRITLPHATKEMAVQSLSELIAAVMRQDPDRTSRDEGSHD